MCWYLVIVGLFEASLNHKRDVENTYSTVERLGHDRGRKEGHKEGKLSDGYNCISV